GTGAVAPREGEGRSPDREPSRDGACRPLPGAGEEVHPGHRGANQGLGRLRRPPAPLIGRRDPRRVDMGFDGEAFVTRFNTVWNGHDVAGILSMMTDDVIFEASFGKDPWGARVVGKPAVREF